MYRLPLRGPGFPCLTKVSLVTRRRLLNLLTLLSLLLCTAVVALGVRSFWRDDVVSRRSGRHWHAAAASRGTLCILVRTEYTPTDAPARWRGASYPSPPEIFRRPRHSFWNTIGFGYRPSTVPHESRTFMHRAWLPLWLPAALAALPPAASIGRRLGRRAAKREHLCARCGDDLRATPNRCAVCRANPRLLPRMRDKAAEPRRPRYGRACARRVPPPRPEGPEVLLRPAAAHRSSLRKRGLAPPGTRAPGPKRRVPPRRAPGARGSAALN